MSANSLKVDVNAWFTDNLKYVLNEDPLVNASVTVSEVTEDPIDTIICWVSCKIRMQQRTIFHLNADFPFLLFIKISDAHSHRQCI